jgi:hypothetical protein
LGGDFSREAFHRPHCAWSGTLKKGYYQELGVDEGQGEKEYNRSKKYELYSCNRMCSEVEIVRYFRSQLVTIEADYFIYQIETRAAIGSPDYFLRQDMRFSYPAQFMFLL